MNGQEFISTGDVVIAMAKVKKKGPTNLDKLMKIADDLFDVRTDEVRNDVIAIPRSGARVAIRLKGRNALSGHLLLEYEKRHGGYPGAQAITGALALIEAHAGLKEPIKTYLRCARLADDVLVIDLGTVDGRCVMIENGKWKVKKAPPEGVVFRRSSAINAMPMPERGGRLSDLRDLFNLEKESWDLVRAWLVLAWLEDIPVPILGLLGPNGAGKSFLASAIVRLVDPAPAPLRRLTTKREDWPIIVNGSRVIGLDNLSRMSLDTSDDICRAVTGEGDQRRQLHTDEDQVIFSYKRAFVLTSIDPGAMRGDFAQRLMAINLRPIDRKNRRGEREMEAEIERMLPKLLGALLTSVAKVIANPVELEELPRMGDAARVMAALDALAKDSDSLAAYERSLGNSVERVLESDPVSETILAFMKDRKKWRGTPTNLYEEMTNGPVFLPDHNWPANAQKLSERLTRISSALFDGKGLIVERGERDERYLELRWSE